MKHKILFMIICVSAILAGIVAFESTDVMTQTWPVLPSGASLPSNQPRAGYPFWVTSDSMLRISNGPGHSWVTVGGSGSSFYWHLSGESHKTDSLRFIQGSNVTLTQSGNTLMIASSGGSTSRQVWYDMDGDSIIVCPQGLWPFALREGSLYSSRFDSVGNLYLKSSGIGGNGAIRITFSTLDGDSGTVSMPTVKDALDFAHFTDGYFFYGGPVVIGDSSTFTALAKFHVVSNTAAEVTQMIEAHASQSADLLRISASGGLTTLAKFAKDGDLTITSNVGVSAISLGDNGIGFQADGSLADTLYIVGASAVAIQNGALSSGVLRIHEDTDNGTNYVGFTVGALSNNVIYSFPTDGASGYLLSTNGSGVLSWSAPGGVSATRQAWYDTDGDSVVIQLQPQTPYYIAAKEGSTVTFSADTLGDVRIKGPAGAGGVVLYLENEAGNTWNMQVPTAEDAADFAGASAGFHFSGGSVMIGTESSGTPGALLHVKSQATGTITEIVQAIASQTAALIETQTSAGTMNFRVAADGDLTINSSSGVSAFTIGTTGISFQADGSLGDLLTFNGASLGYDFDNWIIANEVIANPTTTEISSLNEYSVYMKADKFVIAYNNGGTMTYVSVPLDGSTTTWTHSTSAP